jgi:MinD-like ATPase involved in chromosome partitioning or flagellar assembly
VSRSVAIAVIGPWEGALVTTLERGTDAQIARRCSDLADLLAVAGSGMAQVAMVSADLRALDRTALDYLRECFVTVVGIYPPGDEMAELHLRQLGISTLITADASGQVIQDVLDSLEAQPEREPLAARPTDGPGAGGGDAPDRTRGSVMHGHGAAPVAGGAPTGIPDESGADGSRDESPGSIIAVWGPTGAPGRTTVALNLASELARMGQPTVLVDADTYGGCIAQALSLLDEAPGLAAATRSADQGRLDLEVLARLAPEVSAGLRVLTGIPKAERWPELRAAALEHVLTLTRRLGRFTVIDCGFSLEDDEELSYDTLAPRRNAATLTSLAAADQVLVVGAGDPIGLQRLVRGLQELGAIAHPSPSLHSVHSVPSLPPVPSVTVVVNKVRATAVGPRPERRIREALSRFAGIEEPRFIPDDPATMDAALLAGQSLAEAAPGSQVRQSFLALAGEVSGLPAQSVGSRRKGFGRRDPDRGASGRNNPPEKTAS